GAVLSRFVSEQALHRDARLTAEFIRNYIIVESAPFSASTLISHIDPRVDPSADGLDREALGLARAEIFQHLQILPGALVTNVYAPDRMVIWSTNPVLVGSYARDDSELDEAFATHKDIARHHSGVSNLRHQMKFLVAPQERFVENYVPLLDA